MKVYNFIQCLFILSLFYCLKASALSPQSNSSNSIKKLTSIKRLKEFAAEYKYIQDVYYDDNPSYPRGCRSFALIVAEQMEKEGIQPEIRYSPKRDHVYITVLTANEKGDVEEAIVDYTANQCGIGEVAPVIDTRTALQRKYQEAYDKFWHQDSLFLGAYSNLNDDYYLFNAYLEYLAIVDAIVDKQSLLQAS